MKKIVLSIYFLVLAILSDAQTPSLQWVKQMGGAGPDQGQSIAVDAIGNVYTTGFFKGTVDFDPGPGVFNLITSGYDDIFISKLDSSGNFIWAKSMQGNSNGIGQSITLDASGNIYILLDIFKAHLILIQV